MSSKPNVPTSRHVKLALLSVCAFLVTMACGWLRPRAEPTPAITCYTATVPPATSTPIVMCYAAGPPTPTAAPTVTCYKPVLLTPTPLPSAIPQSRQMLLDRLLAEGRFPETVASQLRQ